MTDFLSKLISNIIVSSEKQYPILQNYKPKLINEEEKNKIEDIFFKRIMNNDNKLYKDEYNDILKNIAKRLKKKKNKQVKIIHRNDLSYLKTLHKHYINKKPLVIKGFPKSNHFTIKNLMDLYGESEVLLFDSKRKNPNFYGKLNSIIDKNKGAYAQNISKFSTSENNKKLPIIDINNDLKQIKIKSNCYQTQLFISTNKGTGVPFHCANDNNFFYMAEGKKKWSFVSPDFTHVFSPYFPDCLQYFLSLSGRESDPIKDYNILYDYIPKYEIILEPGDVLFSPQFWWHSITNLTENTVGCSTRWVSKEKTTTSDLLQRVYHLDKPKKFRADFNYTYIKKMSIIDLLFSKEATFLSQPMDEHSYKKNITWEKASHCGFEQMYIDYPEMNK